MGAVSDVSNGGTEFARSATELYQQMVEFLVQNGCRREEEGSGWWYSAELPGEALMGSAVEHLLQEKYGLDLRDAVPGEPREFWG